MVKHLQEGLLVFCEIILGNDLPPLVGKRSAVLTEKFEKVPTSKGMDFVEQSIIYQNCKVDGGSVVLPQDDVVRADLGLVRIVGVERFKRLFLLSLPALKSGSCRCLQQACKSM